MSEKYVNFTINGAKVKAVQGTNVLDAALNYGICIPHLCHMEGILPLGACRLCIVEVKEGKNSKVVASCVLEVKEGMVIEAHSEKILKASLEAGGCPRSRSVSASTAVT